VVVVFVWWGLFGGWVWLCLCVVLVCLGVLWGCGWGGGGGGGGGEWRQQFVLHSLDFAVHIGDFCVQRAAARPPT